MNTSIAFAIFALAWSAAAPQGAKPDALEQRDPTPARRLPGAHVDAEFLSSRSRLVTQKPRAEEWKEDSEKLRRSNLEVSAQAYQRALESTGMAAVLERRAQGDAAPDGAPDAPGWVRRGPVGGFGADQRNGRISGFRVIPDGSSGKNWLYVAAAQGGVWRTHDDTWGRWEDLGRNLPHPGVRAFDVHPNDPNTLLVGSGEHRRQLGGNIYLTTNAGLSWELIDLQEQLQIVTTYFMRLRHVPSNPSIVLAASDKCMLRSITSGLTWEIALTDSGAAANGMWSDFVFHPTNPEVVYATRCSTTNGLPAGVYRSNDAGATWTHLPDPDFVAGEFWSKAYIAICRDQPNNLAVMVSQLPIGANPPWMLRAVYSSSDGGTNWSDITNGLAGFGGNQVDHTGAIEIHPTDPKRIYLATVDLAVTVDGGASWMQSPSVHGIERGHFDFTQISFSPAYDDSVLFMANDGGIYWADLEGGTTVDLLGNTIDGLANSEVDDLDAVRNFRAIGMQDNGVMASTTSGATWFEVDDFDGGDVEFQAPPLFFLWFGRGAPWTLKRFDGFTKVNTDHPFTGKPKMFHDPIGRITYAPDSSVIHYRPDDLSGAWAKLLDGAPLQPDFYDIRKCTGSKVDGNSLWITYWPDLVGETMQDQQNSDLTLLRRTGATWTITHYEDVVPWSGSGPSQNALETVCTSREWPGELWVGLASPVGKPKLVHSTDFGAHWDDWTANLDTVAVVKAIAVQPFDPTTVYVGTEIGVFRTTNGGQSWLPFQEDLPIAICTDLRFTLSDPVSTDNELVLSMDGRGVWSRAISGPPILFVDKHFTGTSTGAQYSPFKKVADAVAAAPAGAIVAVRGETYAEPQLINKQLKLVTWATSTVID